MAAPLQDSATGGRRSPHLEAYSLPNLRVAGQFRVEPRLGEGPGAFRGRQRNVQGGGGFGHRQPGEEPQLDELRFGRRARLTW